MALQPNNCNGLPPSWALRPCRSLRGSAAIARRGKDIDETRWTMCLHQWVYNTFVFCHSHCPDMLTTPFILLHLWSITSPKHSRFTNPMSRHEWLPHIGVPHISSWPLLTMFSQTMELLDSQPFPSKSLNIRKISDKPKCFSCLISSTLNPNPLWITHCRYRNLKSGYRKLLWGFGPQSQRFY